MNPAPILQVGGMSCARVTAVAAYGWWGLQLRTWWWPSV